MPDYCEICADERPTVARLVDVHNNLWEYYCEKCDPFINLTITALEQERDEDDADIKHKTRYLEKLQIALTTHKRVLGNVVDHIDILCGQSKKIINLWQDSTINAYDIRELECCMDNANIPAVEARKLLEDK